MIKDHYIRLLKLWNHKLYVRVVFQKSCTVEPVSSGDPVLSGRFSNSRIFPLNVCIKRSRLLSGRGHPLRSPNGLFVLFSTEISQMILQIIFQVKLNPCLSPKINVISIFERIFVNFLWYSYSLAPVISGHPIIPHGWSLNTSSTILIVQVSKCEKFGYGLMVTQIAATAPGMVALENRGK